MANELATRSMLELDPKWNHDAVDHASHVAGNMASMSLVDSPRTPSSPSKRKFSFKFSTKTSPKHERRNFAQEAASIPDLQVYSTLPIYFYYILFFIFITLKNNYSLMHNALVLCVRSISIQRCLNGGFYLT